MYDYLERMTWDVKEYLQENFKEGIDLSIMSQEEREEFEQTLFDDMWVSDSVTGNASGSYFCNSARAKECVIDNIDLLKEACQEFGCMDILGEKFVDEEWEWMDVTIRCYLLSQAISEALKVYED